MQGVLRGQIQKSALSADATIAEEQRVCSRKENMRKKLGSKDIAQLENLSQRSVNFIKDKEGFPKVEWIGRTWRVNEKDYELWKANQTQKRGKKNA